MSRLIISILALSLSLFIANCNAAQRTVPAAACDQPQLDLSGIEGYWSNLADYRVGLLSVEFTLENSGSGVASTVTVTESSSSSGVRRVTSLSRQVTQTIDAGSVSLFTLWYLVPTGVKAFRSTLVVTADDGCGDPHEFVLGIPGEGGGGETPGNPSCDTFPADNYWNVPVNSLPLDPASDAYIQTIGAGDSLHPDFGSGLWDGGPIGIPYVVVGSNQPFVDVSFDYDHESDPGPYPIPPDAPVEGGSDSDGDRHVIVLDNDNCMLYELFYSWPQPGGSWQAGSGAVFNLDSNALRPDGWTSADAAGLPIYPGLVRYDEVTSGVIDHAIRFTAPQTRQAYVWPARHFASDLTGQQYPPMGQRFRLKDDFDTSSYSLDMQVILAAMKTYGIVLADNGASWFISGAPDERWDNDELSQLKQLRGSDFEAVDATSLMVDPDSGETSP